MAVDSEPVGPLMRLWPPPLVEQDALVVAESGHRAPHPHRPWTLLNMVTSLDGATASNGVTGGLGGRGDRAMLVALRSIADVILVAAGTVRAESYGPPTSPEESRIRRLARGQSSVPRLVVVTRALDLDPAAPVFGDTDNPVLVITTDQAPKDRRRQLEGVAEVVSCGIDSVNIAEALVLLGERGAGVCTIEGGPSLNGVLLNDDLVDEIRLTTAGKVVGGTTPPWSGAVDAGRDLAYELSSLHLHGNDLFRQYLRRRDHN